MSDYPKFGSIARRYREITITEKIDGTNGLISINKCEDDPEKLGLCMGEFHIRAGSRNRWLTPEDDNFGFARWVHEHRESLVADLGEGMHYGEWWGLGIQRGYGLKEKRFSLFNVKRWYGIKFDTPNLSTVPVIFDQCANTDVNIRAALSLLQEHGSFGDFGGPRFMNPEGIVIWDHAARIYQKVTLENDGIPKSQVK
jgi:hypothetical protein